MKGRLRKARHSEKRGSHDNKLAPVTRVSQPQREPGEATELREGMSPGRSADPPIFQCCPNRHLCCVKSSSGQFGWQFRGWQPPRRLGKLCGQFRRDPMVPVHSAWFIRSRAPAGSAMSHAGPTPPFETETSAEPTF